MRRLGRWTLNACTALSLLLGLALAILCGRSAGDADDTFFGVRSFSGLLISELRWSNPPAGINSFWARDVDAPGLKLDRIVRGGAAYRELVIDDWLFIAVVAVLPVARVARYHLRSP